MADSVATPLANPLTLRYLMDDTLEAVCATLRQLDGRGTLDAPVCACGRNPYLAYFRAGTQALFEALVQIQAGMTNLEPVQRVAAFHELSLAINEIAIEEIGTFGSLCIHCDRSRHKSATACPVRKGGSRDRLQSPLIATVLRSGAPLDKFSRYIGASRVV